MGKLKWELADMLDSIVVKGKMAEPVKVVHASSDTNAGAEKEVHATDSPAGEGALPAEVLPVEYATKSNLAPQVEVETIKLAAKKMTLAPRNLSFNESLFKYTPCNFSIRAYGFQFFENCLHSGMG